MSIRRLVSALFASLLALVAVSCGSDDDDSGPAADPIEARIDELFPDDPGFGELNRAQVRAMLETPPEEDGPFYMVNLIRHRPYALYHDGRETDLTGREADDLYGSLILPILFDIGARPIFVADVEVNLQDPDRARWTQVGVVLYPSRAAFLDMVAREDLRDAAVHKSAGVESSIVLVTEPGDAVFPPEFRQVDLDDVPYPPTDDDPPIAIAHLYKFNDIARYADGRETDLSGREALALYEQGRSDQGVLELGVRPGIWLEVEGWLFGDGRDWDEFRLNNFPSRATFREVITAEALAEAGIEHRDAAIEYNYSAATAPFVNEVGYE